MLWQYFGVIAIRRKLLAWYDAKRRDLPWRKNTDPYRVWLSEIMLQQTRVAAVIPYFERFLELFPTVQALAAARPQRVLHAWAGLGYYSRARALHNAARAITRSGAFPDTHDAWLELPGIGPYTAAAISSIALGEPRAVLDGNVRRVLSRLFATHDGLEETAGKLLDRKRPGDFNQAVMELGAVVCLPKSPLCVECPVARHCDAHKAAVVDQFPARKAKAAPRELRYRLLLAERNGNVLLQRPGTTGYWANFWTLPELREHGAKIAPLGEFRHSVTIYKMTFEVFRTQWPEGAAVPAGCRWVKHGELPRLPLSTPTKKALALARQAPQ